jgi:hypothetical protein
LEAEPLCREVRGERTPETARLTCNQDGLRHYFSSTGCMLRRNILR